MSELQRLVWLLSMPIAAEIINAMQELKEVDFTNSVQNKDMSDTGIKRGMQDTKTCNSGIYGKPEIHLVKILSLEAL